MRVKLPRNTVFNVNKDAGGNLCKISKLESEFYFFLQSQNGWRISKFLLRFKPEKGDSFNWCHSKYFVVYVYDIMCGIRRKSS